MYIEEQAKKKWCPFVRHDELDGGTFNRGGLDAINSKGAECAQCNCIASECMAWRWIPITDDRIKRIKQHSNETGCGLKEAKEWCDNNPIESNNGYCGLAGKP